MQKIKIIFLLIIWIFTGNALFAQNSDLNQIGTSMANFLKIGAGARATAMGNAFVAMTDDASAAYWNPGGLALIENNETMIQVTNWFAGTKHYFLSTTFSLGDFATVAVSATAFNSGDMEETTIYEPEGTGRLFSTSDIAAGISIARRFTDHFSAGVTVKYISESLDRSNASSFAMDIGSVFITNILNGMKIGISLSNLGSMMKLDGSDLTVKYLPDNGTKYVNSQLRTEAWDIPLLFRFGLATDVIRNTDYRFSVSGELLDSRDYDYRFSAGGEFSFQDIIAFRGGYKFNYSEADFSFGFGLDLQKLTGIRLKADYSFNNFGVLDDIHSISISIGY